MRKAVILTCILAALAGCAVGPDYQAPDTPEPADFEAGRETVDGEMDPRRFWQGFDDPLLAKLIDQTLEANHELEVAVARYERAAALLYGAAREQWPSVTASGSAAEQHLADIERSPPGGGPDRVQRYQVGVAAEWELDLFGRLRRATEAQRAEVEAAGADRGAVQVALVGQLTSSYFELRGLQQQYRVAQKSVALQQQSLDIVEARLEAGRGTDFDVVRARAQVERTSAELPRLQAGIRAVMHRISVLTGQPPVALLDTLSPVVGLPDALPDIPVDTPGNVLRRRPDIAAAERRLAAATAREGVATADLFPRFTLAGLLGSVAGDASDLLSGPAESRRVVLGIDWTFLDHDKVRARIEAAGAESRAALARYQQAVLVALEEAETRLVRYQQAQVREVRLQRAMSDAGQAVELARTRYEQGLIGYYELLAAEQDFTTTRDQAVRSRTEVILAMVDVYRALVGAPDPGADTHVGSTDV